MIMDLFSTLQLLHEAAMSVLVTTIYGRWRVMRKAPLEQASLLKKDC